jgi:hypothetical protein
MHLLYSIYISNFLFSKIKDLNNWKIRKKIIIKVAEKNNSVQQEEEIKRLLIISFLFS